MRPWRVQDGGGSTIKRTSHSSFTVEVHLLRFTSAEVENKSGVFLTNWRSICTDSGNPERKRAYGPDMLFLNEKPRFTPTHSSVNSHRLKKYKHLVSEGYFVRCRHGPLVIHSLSWLQVVSFVLLSFYLMCEFGLWSIVLSWMRSSS